MLLKLLDYPKFELGIADHRESRDKQCKHDEYHVTNRFSENFLHPHPLDNHT